MFANSLTLFAQKKMTFELKIYVQPSCEREPAFEDVLIRQLKISRQFGVKWPAALYLTKDLYDVRKVGWLIAAWF